MLGERRVSRMRLFLVAPLTALRLRRQIAFEPPINVETVNPNVELRGCALLRSPARTQG
jgi:hypothetical protein